MRNSLHINGNTRVGHSFGELRDLRPIAHVHGLGHEEHVRAEFKGHRLRTSPSGDEVWTGSVVIEFCPADLAKLHRLIPIALSGLPVEPDCSGARADLEEGA